LNHVFVQGTSFPKGVVLTHLVAYYSFFSMSDVDVILKQLRKGYVVIFAVDEFGSFLQSLLNDSMRDLCVKHEVTENVELVCQR